MTARVPPGIPSRAASTPILNDFLNVLASDPSLKMPSRETLALIAILDRQLMAMKRQARNGDEV